ERSEDLIQRRILAMQEQLDLLRLRYHDTYPDIISLQEQIQELTAQREAGVGANNPRMSSQGEDIINPLYQELRAELAKVLTSIETIHTRIRSLEALLETEVARMERIQANKAQFAELTRDMEVNTSIYNDLLKRREKARVSMHLDIEGQGLSYRIHEPAQFPTAPSGGNFTQFAAAGLFLGILAPFGIIAGLLQVDPRIRTEDTVIEHVGLPVLGMIPEVRTPFERRKDRNRTVFIGILVLLVLAGYVTVATARWLGWF
ncbi:MAG: lipopolysaccharide biosynthesis protein, partial [Gammaproteobacteria bacterium]|nr:lipopolysaccharide biosynthesis protein [Gammaproteobacteria bacterium]